MSTIVFNNTYKIYNSFANYWKRPYANSVNRIFYKRVSLVRNEIFIKK